RETAAWPRGEMLLRICAAAPSFQESTTTIWLSRDWRQEIWPRDLDRDRPILSACSASGRALERRRRARSVTTPFASGLFFDDPVEWCVDPAGDRPEREGGGGSPLRRGASRIDADDGAPRA